MVPAQTTDSSHADARRTVFSVQPSRSGFGNARLELERSVTDRISVVLGSGLTLRNPSYALRNTFVSELDLGARFYPGGRAFHGLFAGVYAGYERNDRSRYTIAERRMLPNGFVGATTGYDVTLFRRLIIGPAIGLEYGRPSFDGSHSFVLKPRVGIGFNFD
jgi:hypothetical protein